MSTQFEVEVAYARPEAQCIVRVRVPLGARVRHAIERSNLLEQFPEIDLGSNAVGIWGHPVSLERVLLPRDRVEIYRPLSIDPKQARRIRAKKTY